MHADTHSKAYQMTRAFSQYQALASLDTHADTQCNPETSPILEGWLFGIKSVPYNQGFWSVASGLDLLGGR